MSKVLKAFIATATKDYYQGMCIGPSGNIYENYHKSIQLVERSYDDWSILSHVPLTAATNRDMGIGYSKVTGHFYAGDPWTQGAVEYTADGQTKVRAWLATGNITGIFCEESKLYACSNYSKFIKVWDIGVTAPIFIRDIHVGFIQGGCCIRNGMLWVSELGTKTPPSYIWECDMEGKKTGNKIEMPENRAPWSIVCDKDNYLWVRSNWQSGSVKVFCIDPEDGAIPEPKPEPEEETENILEVIWSFIGTIFGFK